MTKIDYINSTIIKYLKIIKHHTKKIEYYEERIEFYNSEIEELKNELAMLEFEVKEEDRDPYDDNPKDIGKFKISGF